MAPFVGTYQQRIGVMQMEEQAELFVGLRFYAGLRITVG